MNIHRQNIISYICILFVLFIAIMPFPMQVHAEDNTPSVNGETAILIDGATGRVLFDKNSKQQMYPASITKIITGIVAIEQGNLLDVVTISENAAEAEGTNVYLLPDEQVTMIKLLQGLLMNSGNDAAVAIAEHIDGSVEKFAERMNDFVTNKIGISSSHFNNPHGLFDGGHYTTAYDMAMITAYAMKNETFRTIVGTKELEWKGEGWETVIINHNLMLRRYEGATGVKNGYVPESRHTLVTSAKRGNTELIAVTMKAPSSEAAYEDMVTLLDYGFANYETKKLTFDPSFIEQHSESFALPKEITYTANRNEDVRVEITEDGTLRLMGIISNEQVYEQSLEKIKVDLINQELVNATQEKEPEKTTKSLFQWIGIVLTWVLTILYIAFLVLLSYFIVKKKKDRERSRGL